MPRPTEHIIDYPDYSGEVERQRFASIDLQKRDTHRAGSGGDSDSSRASTPRSSGRISVDTKSKPPNRMQMPLDIVPPQRDLVPLWDGAPIYGTPDTPASPLDCDRWPSSPYCGGNPFDWKPIGIGVEAVNDGGGAVNKEGCNIGIQISPVVMFMKMPPIQIVARNPWCKPLPPLPPPPPKPAPTTTETTFDLGNCDDWRIIYNPQRKPIPDYRYSPPGTLSNQSIELSFFSSPDQLAGVSLVSVRNNTTKASTAYIKISKVIEVVDIYQVFMGTLNSYIALQRGRIRPLNDNQCEWQPDVNFALSRKVYDLPIQIYLANGELELGAGSNTYLESVPNWIIGRCVSNAGVIPVQRPGSPPDTEPPPWEPPPPPPEPRKKRDEECECMCCNDGNTEALLALLMQQLANQNAQLANQASQIASLQTQITSSTNTILNNQRPVDLSPVLNDTSSIKDQLAGTETRLAEKIDKIDVDLTPVLNDTNLIKEKLDNVKVDLKPVLDKLENIDEDVAKLSDNLGVFPGEFNDGDGGDLTFNNHAELVYEVYKALGRKFSSMSEKQGDLLALIGEPLEIRLYDEDLGQVGVQEKSTTPKTLFQSIALSTTRGEIALKGIGVEQYPIKYTAGEEEKEIRNLSALTWAIANAIPVDIFPRVVKWKAKDEKGQEREYERTFNHLSDIIFNLIGIPIGVTLFDEDTEKEGKQPKFIMPMSLFEIIALNFSRTEILAERVGIDMFPITLKPQFSEDALINLNVLGEDRSILDQVLDLLGTIDPISWIFDFSGTLQGVMDLAGDAWNTLNAIVSYYSETKKLHNLVELINFTRELIVESNDEDGFPIVVEKEQIDGDEDLGFESKADAIEEILILLYNLAKTNGYQTDIGLKCLAESVHTKAIAAMTQGEVRSMADFMDYPSNAVARPLKIHINCPVQELADGDVDLDGAEDLDKLLTESTIEITFDEWTGKRSLTDMLRDLLNQAASARGDATRRVGD